MGIVIDYKSLLERYMKYVADESGVIYCPASERRGYNPDELDALESMADDVYDQRKRDGRNCVVHDDLPPVTSPPSP
jgi:hypothetical protein